MAESFSKEKRLKMFEEFFHIFDQWMTLHEDGVTLAMILEKKGYKKIALYGMGTMALHVIQDLKNSSVKVLYIIEKEKESYYTDIEIKTLKDDNLPKVDMIIYTLELKNKTVLDALHEQTGAKICGLGEVVFDNIEALGE